ncbi:MAG: hypothetical protein KF716_03830 [Anaerolineae bacterium]|nr:hypothetical protein [Anaerolineae bacterium]
MTFITDVILLLISFLLWTPAFIGLGTLLTTENIMYAGLAGMLLTGVVVNLINFLFPVTPIVGAALLIVGWALVIRRRKLPMFTFSPALVRWGIVWLIISILIQRIGLGIDTGVYYIQAIKWINESALPLGLGTLHGRFGFNSLWFSVAAGMNVSPVASISVIDGILLWMVGSYCCAQHGKELADYYFNAVGFLLLPTLYLSSYQTSSASPDLAITLLTMVAVHAFLTKAKTLSLLVIFALMIKISAVPLVLLLRPTRRTLILATLLLIPWFGRSFMISGCAVYPVKSTCLPVSWQTPDWMFQYDNMAIRTHSRLTTLELLTDEELAQRDWISGWLQRAVSAEPHILITILLSGLGLISAVILKRRINLPLFPLLMCAVGLVVWWITAPAQRFALGYLFTIAGLMLATAKLPLRMLTATLLPLLLAFILFVIPNFGLGIPPTDLAVKDGVYYPQDDDFGACWDAPLPCTMPNFIDNYIDLITRDPSRRIMPIPHR